MLLLLYLVLPWLCVAAIPGRRGRGGLAERLVYGIAAHEVLLLVVGLSLGLTHRLSARNYAIATAILSAALAALAVRNRRRPDRPVVGWRVAALLRTRRGAAAALVAVLVSGIVGIQLVADAVAGTRHWDGLWYHVPRLLFWTQQRSFDAWPTATWQQIGLPVGADVVLGAKVLLGYGWAGTAYVTAWLTLGSIAGVYVAAVDLRMGRWRALLAALLFASFPAVGERIATLNSDIAAAFPIVAAYVALTRLRDARVAVATFVFLDAVGIACKPTVAPLALLAAGVGLWRSGRRVLAVGNLGPATAASVAGSAVVLASYWPVFRAFGDFVGGDFGRACGVSSASEFFRSALASVVHWCLEPLAYVQPLAKRWIASLAGGVYGAIGLQLDHGILGTQTLADWWPMPGPDVGRTGLVPLVAFPFVGAALPSPAARRATIFWWAGLVAISGLIYAQPWSGRFTILLLAPYALAWGGTRWFARRRARWLLAAIVGVNAAGTLAITAAITWLYWGVESRAGGKFHYLDDQERSSVAATLAGSPLAVVGEGSLDALLAGPEIAFPIANVVCRAGSDLGSELRRAASTSRALAVVHGGAESIRAGPAWRRRGSPSCPMVPVASLHETLAASGWVLSRAGPKLDVWVRAGPAAVNR